MRARRAKPAGWRWNKATGLFMVTSATVRSNGSVWAATNGLVPGGADVSPVQ